MSEGNLNENLEKKKIQEIHIPSQEEQINEQLQGPFQIQQPVQNLATRINEAENVQGPVRAVRFLPGSKTLTREYLGQLRADLGDEQRDSKKHNVKSRLYKKDQNANALNQAAMEVEGHSQGRIQALTERFGDFDEETIKSLTYFNVHEDSITKILDELTVFLFQVDLRSLHLENDETIVQNAVQLEKLSCQVKAYDRLLKKNPEYLDQVGGDVREKIEKKLTQLNSVALFYDAKKSVMTDQYFIAHYNEELSMDIKDESSEAEKRLAQKLMDTYVLGRRLLRINGVSSMEILNYGGIVQNNNYKVKLLSNSKKKYCADENNGSFVIDNLATAFRNLDSSGSIWGDSNEMKQVKAEVTATRNLLYGSTEGKLFEDLKVSTLDALGRLYRACNMYVGKKIKNIKTDTSRRHLSVLNIMEAAKMGIKYLRPLTEESYRSHNPEGEVRTLADVMRDSKEDIVQNVEEKEKTDRQLERNRHYEIKQYLVRLVNDGSSFNHRGDHEALVQKLQNKIPRDHEKFLDAQYMIERDYKDLIEECDKYLEKRHPYERSTMVREIRETYTKELDRIRKLDFYDIHKEPGDKNWESCIIGGSAYVTMVNQTTFACDDGRENIQIHTGKEAENNYSYIKAAKALGFEKGMFKDYQDAFVTDADGNLVKKIITTKDNPAEKKWVGFGDLINIAQDIKSNLVYSETALRQLSSIQILDELLGIRNRNIKSLKYLGKTKIVLGEPTLIIESVRIEDSIAIPTGAAFNDGAKDSVYDQNGKFRLPAYDRTVADKIMKTDAETFLNSLERGGIQLTQEQKDGFTARFNRLKAAFEADSKAEDGWRKWQEGREERAANIIVNRAVKRFKGY